VTPQSYATLGATAIADGIRQGDFTARDVALCALARIEALDRRYNAFTSVTAERALSAAGAIDALRARGGALPPLAGVPFAVKNLFDIAGVTTLAGAKIEAQRAPAAADATLVARLAASGGVLVGALNMEEYAYGFVSENAHYGAVRNPHDVSRVAGGSSGGSGAALAAGLVPLTLGTDTNGSIRVPAALCGVFGLKPTYGRLSRSGVFPLAASFDHAGPLARSVADLAIAYDAMQGPDAADIACAQRDPQPVAAMLDNDIGGLRIAVADGYFQDHASEDARDALRDAAEALGVKRTVTLAEIGRVRAAGYLITASEAGELHLRNLRSRANDFDPASRDRLLAATMVPAAWYLTAQRFRAWFREQVREVLRSVDVILAPATPVAATPIGATAFELNGHPYPPRTHLGMLTYPFSFLGLPVVAAPVAHRGNLPLGIQVIAAPWREDHALQVARALEQRGVARADVAAAALR
jgi:AtzE family amidohydrolase